MPRRFGQEISSNIRRRPHLTPEQRSKIIGAHEAGSSYRQIKDRYGVPKSTIGDAINHALQRNNAEDLPRAGRPRELDTRTIRHIKRFINGFPKATYKQVQTHLSLSCSRKTIYRELKAYGIIKWRARKRPFLTPAHAHQRLSFARKYRHWTPTDWRKVIWSDECSVERGKGKRKPWIFRTPINKWDSKCVVLERIGKDLSIMIWASFSGALGRSDLVVMERDPDSR